MGNRIWSCPNRQYAEGFLDGIELVNDSALRAESCVCTEDGTYVFTLQDDDFDGMETFIPAAGKAPPTPIALEQLRSESQGEGADRAR